MRESLPTNPIFQSNPNHGETSRLYGGDLIVRADFLRCNQRTNRLSLEAAVETGEPDYRDHLMLHGLH